LGLQEMSKQKKDKKKGFVTKHLKGIDFEVELKNGKTIRAYLSGKMRHNQIKTLPGDKVLVEIGPYEEKGRIIYRL